MLVFKAVVVISIFCLLDGFVAQMTLEDRKVWLTEVSKYLEEMSNIHENKSDISYSDAEKWLKTKTKSVKNQCDKSEELNSQIESYAHTFNTIVPFSNSKKLTETKLPAVLPAIKAKQLWDVTIELFSALSHCLPIGSAWNNNVTINMVSIVSREIVRRLPSYADFEKGLEDKLKCADSPLNECLNYHNDWKDNTFFDEMLLPIAPIAGTCEENIGLRKCGVRNVQNCTEDVIESFKIILSPPGPEPYCKYLNNL